MLNVEINRTDVNAYGWRCAASSALTASTNIVVSGMTAFEAFTHGVKRTPATAGRAATRGWKGPIT